MKLISFLFLSTALHAAALAYPALFLDWKAATPIAVTMLEVEGGSGDGSADEGSAPRKKTMRFTWKALPENREEQIVAKVEPHFAEPVQAVSLPTMISTPVVSEGTPAAVAVAARRSEEASVGKYSSLSGDGEEGAGRASGAGGRGGDGSGSSGLGAGSGNGYGNGVAGSPVSYASCPKPDYPESARREGWEGTVTLRVLVDEEGKSKSLEVNRSSGFAVLDQAAIDNVKRRCRFHPAREGEKRVESWIRIPVIFRLADLGDR